jgi:hypothetical protein
MSVDKESKVTTIVAIVGCTSAFITLFANSKTLPTEVFYVTVILLSGSFLLVIGFGFLKPSIDSRRSRRDAIVTLLESCKSTIGWVTEQKAERDEWQYSPNIPRVGFLAELATKVEEYVERYQRCGDLFLACECVITSEIIKWAISCVPKTQEKFPLDKLMTGKTDILCQLVNGKEPTKRWIEEKSPNTRKDIVSHLEEPEDALNIFFYELDNTLGQNKVVTRFRTEKQQLIQFAEVIKRDIDSEVERLSRKTAILTVNRLTKKRKDSV